MHLGEYGWHTTRGADVLDFSRAVSIGWSVRYADLLKPCLIEPKAVIVQPSDFAIAKKATDVHKITDRAAREQGRPLEDVLREFLTDVNYVCAGGGRLCAHHFEVHP